MIEKNLNDMISNPESSKQIEGNGINFNELQKLLNLKDNAQQQDHTTEHD
jgi:hypothetical protein